MSSETPDLGELLSELAAFIKGSLCTAIPAKVVQYNSAQQTALVKPTISGRFVDPATGALLPFSLPTIANVPVIFPSGGGFSITWQLAVGDTVLLVISDRSLDEWKSTGAAENVPQDIRRFDLTDAVAIPGLRPNTEPIGPDGVLTFAMVLRGPEIRLGSAAATDFVALASKVLAELNKIKAAFDGHIHPDPASGNTGIPTVAMPSPGDVGATKVKAE